MKRYSLATLKVVISIVISIGLLAPLTATAQQAPTQLFFGAGPAFLGEVPGLVIINEIQVPVAHRFFISGGFQYTRHSGNTGFFPSEYRYATAGVNLHADINYSVLETAKHRIAIGIGPYARHQTDTYAGISIRYIGQVRSTEIIYNEKMNTLSAGYHIAPSYYMVLTRRLVGGIRVALQNDTNGEIMTSSNLMIGVKL